MSVTIKDIARVAKVSHTTVSRALNDSPFIKEETKVEILKIAKELKYHTNVNAKSLVTNKSFTIGLFFSSITNGTSSSFFAQVITGVNSLLSNEYNLFVKGIDTLNNFDQITKSKYDGIIVMSQSPTDDEFISHVFKEDIALVVLNRVIDNEEIYNVIPDDYQGAYELVNYLISKDYQNIAMIKGKDGFTSTSSRYFGYESALEDNNIKVNQKLVLEGDYSIRSGYLKTLELLKNNNNKVDVIFCSNDDMAVGALNALYELGLRVNEDISIVGFDNIDFSNYTNPPLTSVDRAITKISCEGISILLKLIEDEKLEKCKTIIKPTIIIRKSTRN